MKRSYILAFFAVMLLVSGCDFFRKVAGRPTSADLQAKRTEITYVEAQKAELAREQARLDSLEAVAQKEREAREMAERDSLAAHQTLKEKGCQIYELKSLKGLSSG